MNHTVEKEINLKELRRLYSTDTCARALLDHISQRRYNSFESTVDRLEAVLKREGADCSRRDVVGALRSLEQLKCGTFVMGRRGQASRFQWGVEMIGVGKAARGEETMVEPLKQEEARPEDTEEKEGATRSIRHTFNLRPDYTVTVDLPSDFSQKEALRLAEFVKTLPFDEAAVS